MQRPPQPLVRAVPHRQAVGVVDAETVVVVLAVVLGVEEEHRGQRREAEVGDLVAGEDRRLDVDLGDLPGPQGEAEGAGGALAVEERVDDDAVAGRRLDPVGAEEGELLALRLAGADGEAAGAGAEDLVARDRLEVAGAGEGGEGDQGVGLVERGQHPETGEPGRKGVGRRRHDVAEGVEVGVVGDRARLPVLDQEDLDGTGVDEARVDEFDAEAGRRIGEEPPVVAEADRGVVFGGERGERVRQGIGRLEGLGGELARPVEHDRAAELAGLLRPGVARTRGAQGQRRRGSEKGSPLHHRAWHPRIVAAAFVIPYPQDFEVPILPPSPLMLQLRDNSIGQRRPQGILRTAPTTARGPTSSLRPIFKDKALPVPAQTPVA